MLIEKGIGIKDGNGNISSAIMAYLSLLTALQCRNSKPLCTALMTVSEVETIKKVQRKL